MPTAVQRLRSCWEPCRPDVEGKLTRPAQITARAFLLILSRPE